MITIYIDTIIMFPLFFQNSKIKKVQKMKGRKDSPMEHLSFITLKKRTKASMFAQLVMA